MIHLDLLSVSLLWMVITTFAVTAVPTKTSGSNRTMVHHYRYPCRGAIQATAEIMGYLPTAETPQNCIPALKDKLYYLQQRMSKLIDKYVSEHMSKDLFICVLPHVHLWKSFDNTLCGQSFTVLFYLLLTKATNQWDMNGYLEFILKSYVHISEICSMHACS